MAWTSSYPCSYSSRSRACSVSARLQGCAQYVFLPVYGSAQRCDGAAEGGHFPFFTVAGAAAVHAGCLLVVVDQGSMGDSVEVASVQLRTGLLVACCYHGGGDAKVGFQACHDFAVTFARWTGENLAQPVLAPGR